MTRDFFSESSFAKSYDKARKNLKKNLKSFRRDPNEDGTHDVRTAIRKTDAALELLPKKMRSSKKTTQLKKNHKKIMRESATIRDLDIISARISRHPQSPARKSLLKKIKKNRKDRVAKATRIANSIRRLSVPKSGAVDLPPEKLQKRFSKEVAKLSEGVNATLPTVLNNPANAEEIHTLRKYCKRLRYLFELASSKNSEIASILKTWQDQLGAVHDGDVTIAYLSKAKKSTEIEEMVATELRDRNHDYEKFLEICLNR